MSSWKLRLLLTLTCLSTCGCAEGLFWRAGKYTPWVQNQWAEEEKIADTLFSKKRRVSELTASALQAPIEEKQRVAEELATYTRRNQVLLLRLFAIQHLGDLNCPASISALQTLSTDKSSDIRMAVIKAWQKLPGDQAIPQLQKMLGSDTDIDVRLAATRALANFSGQQTVAAIALALNDPDPALQLRATESLQQVTGESLGRNVQAWQDYVSQTLPSATKSLAIENRETLLR